MKKRISLMFIAFALILNTLVFAEADQKQSPSLQSQEEVLDVIDVENMIEIDIKKYTKIGDKLNSEAVSGSKASKYYYPTRYYQTHTDWGDDWMESQHKQIKDEGCALTSFAMLASLYGSNDNPGEVNDVMGEKACKFYWYVGGTNYNLPTCHYSRATLSNTVAKGAIAGILEEEGVCIVGMSSPSSPHFVLARGYYSTSSGTGIRIYDPSSGRDYNYLSDYLDNGYTVNRLIYYSN